ncbi:MAG: aldehyde dehydrogenase (NADP(+)) [Canibacter sp.]
MSAELAPEIDEVLTLAADAAPIFATTSADERATLLGAIATGLESNRDLLLPLAEEETGLSTARLTGELTRTAVQLRAFGAEVTRGDHFDARVDHADPNFILGAKPDIRRTHLPLGPVVNFAASNFPFAFSVAGGDTASILAAGCPVILKGHEAHPQLSIATARIVSDAVASVGLPEGVFQLIRGREAGVGALRDSRVKAGAFTGSIAGGRALADIAGARPDPIPFFGELGSVNPVFVTPLAIAERGSEIAEGYVASVSGSAGQLCTKPGFLFIPEDHGLGETVALAASQVPEHRLLAPRIGEQFTKRRQEVLDAPGVTPVAAGSVRFTDDGNAWATPTIVQVSLDDLCASRDTIIEEVFGPFSVMVTYQAGTNLAAAVDELFDGNLAGGLHLAQSEESGENAQQLFPLVNALAQHAGRVLFNGWPTGVAVTPAMTHGGPWPATTNDSSTSVGMAALSRWQRPVTYQNVPEAFLPGELQDAPVGGIHQRITTPEVTRLWSSF